MLTQREIRRENQAALAHPRQLDEQIATQNLLAMISAEEVARFMTLPVDLSGFEGEGRSNAR